MARIVVGVDGSEESKAALRWAVGEARLRGASVRAVYAWSLPYVAAAPGLVVPQGDVADFRRDGEEMLDALVAEVGNAGVDVERVAVEGGPAHVLVEAAEGADLLVVGSRGHGGFAGLLLGSVSQQVAHHAPCPVVIVRGEARS
jgi:nucleotide-binding universal stress UspA family protein